MHAQRCLRHDRILPALLMGSCLLLSACATRQGYLNHLQPSLAQQPQPTARDSKPMYLDLIRQMQQQGAYYASLANIDAFNQRYGNPPELRRLRADALREIGQPDAARTLYEKLVDTDQAGPAWHGLGLIAAAAGQDRQAETDLVNAVQIDPVNPGYLGDLGYQRLRAGQIAQAHEPLAKAAELAPANVKAVSNLVLWMLLSNDYAQADAAMDRASLPAPARQQIRELAMQLQLSHQVQQGHHVASLSGQAALPPPATRLHAASLPTSTTGGVPDTMLERFSSSTTPSEAHP